MRPRRDDAARKDDGVTRSREGWRRETRAEETDRDETTARREGGAMGACRGVT